jgi:Alr-MurF fusion protein
LSPDYAYKDLLKILNGKAEGQVPEQRFCAVAYDSRNIVNGGSTVFFALKGPFRDGHQFISDAYEKGVRCFVVNKLPGDQSYPEAGFIVVKNSLHALQELAAHHRSLFSYPVVAITGSAGKTTVKEWIYHLLGKHKRIIRSPKSYNSQLGVALSLLELHADCDLALIEAGISAPGEMLRLEQMIRPTHGVFTGFGRAHEENFKSREEHFNEKVRLFVNVKQTIYPSHLEMSPVAAQSIHGIAINAAQYQKDLKALPFTDPASVNNALLAIAFTRSVLGNSVDLKEAISTLPQLALRMETFDGLNKNTIINDAYNLDLDALTHSLEYQMRLAGKRKRIVIIGLDEASRSKREQIEKIVKPFSVDQLLIIDPNETPELIESDAVVLIKGTRNADMQRLARQYRLKKHTTYVEIDLTAVRSNLEVFRSMLAPETKLLAMVKAQSYGSGIEKMGDFLQKQGVDYLGVAYADEGIELRKQGIDLPILVMNTEEEGFEDCIRYNLEPAIFTLRQLDGFIRELILHGRSNYPIHLKLDTGMRRLGFELKELGQVCDVLKAQPEVYVKSVYSHLADADNRRDKRFTLHQIAQFAHACTQLQQRLNYSFLRHILNSEGVSNYPEAQFDMVRLGIGMYGISSNPAVKRKLQPVISWITAVSQVKQLKKGDSVGYGRTFIAQEAMEIAILPVGYADGYRRSLSNGKGLVYINGKACSVVGRVCMDMIMVNVTNKKVKEGDRVELIGKHYSIEKLAEAMGTIAYEVMTGISRRVNRVYLEE